MKENKVIDNFIYLNKNLNFGELKENTLILEFNDIDFSIYNKVSVFIKNIKTREVFKCSSFIRNTEINVNLDSIKHLCTDYEYIILIRAELNNSSYIIYPKFTCKSKTYISNNSSKNNHRWFIRISENGELRLSTIFIFPNQDNVKENVSF